MFNKSTDVLPITPPPVPSLDARLNGALAGSESARSAFLIAALDLDSAANELDNVAADTQAELDRLVEILETAINRSDENRAAAKRLRALVEPEHQQLSINYFINN